MTARASPSPTISAPTSNPRARRRGGAHEIGMGLLRAEAGDGPDDEPRRDRDARALGRPPARREAESVDAVVQHGALLGGHADTVALAPELPLTLGAEDHGIRPA